MASERSFVSAAIVGGLCTLLSRITGFARDVLLTTTFGLQSITDAFWFAFTVPNLLRRLFAEGAIAAVFVPPFSRLLAKDDLAGAERLLARATALQTVSLTIIVLLIELLIWAIAVFGAPAAPPGATSQNAATLLNERGLMLTLTAIMQPYTIAVCVVALLASILNCLGSFAPAALTSAILNVVMLVALLIGRALQWPTAQQAIAVAISVVIAGVVQFVFLLFFLSGRRVRLGWEWNTTDPEVRGLLATFVPVVFGQGALMLGTFIDNLICWAFRGSAASGSTGTLFGWTFRYPLDEGAIATLNIAQRLYQFPLGVAAIALGTAALPMLSRLIATEDWAGWNRQMRLALRLALYVGLLAGTLLVAMPASFVRLLFEYGRVGPEGTARAAPVLAAYGWGMWAFCVQHIVLRGFYSRGDTTTPLRLSAFLVPLNVAISFVLIWHPAIREAAFGWSTAITSTLSVFVGLWLLNRPRAANALRGEADGALVDGALLSATVRMFAISVASAWLLMWLAPWLLRTGRGLGIGEVGARALETFGGITIGTLVFLIVGAIVRLPEPRMVIATALRQRRSATKA
ncbi:MAG: murein biosynthesis integral membrane protein MurJ [Phycisphaerae bacterium]|nr:murein biosynthesis integral membrane protein MurJ [Phycisphaerae bacterium]